jgi:hypothetical protein
MPDGGDTEFTDEELRAMKELAASIVAGGRVYRWVRAVAIFSVSAAGFLWVVLQIGAALKLQAPR